MADTFSLAISTTLIEESSQAVNNLLASSEKVISLISLK
jgi:hypothetical protein